MIDFQITATLVNTNTDTLRYSMTVKNKSEVK